MCDVKDEEEEVTIVEVRMNNDRKWREMERSSERKDGNVCKCPVKDELFSYEVSYVVQTAMRMGAAQSVYTKVAETMP